ncbi:hypothetical protein V6N13_005452 [Hibiscus sabdariffa]|uniref:Uncharacterized protein n=1 Tax=Hibiscus sabdariffa TaxID=183260 RepID=A0ABR2EQN7_9ROSI
MQFADILSAARKDAGEYPRAVMKDQTVPEALMELVRAEAASTGSEEKTKCSTPASIELKAKGDGKKPTFSDDFKPEPNLSAYGDDVELKGKKKSFTSDFEPEPDLILYQG